MRSTPKSCRLLFLSCQIFSTLQTPMELGSSSRAAELARPKTDTSETARQPWAVPKYDGGDLRILQLAPPPGIQNDFFSQEPEKFDCKSYFEGLKSKNLATRKMAYMQEFIAQWSSHQKSRGFTSFLRPGGRSDEIVDRTATVQKIFVNLLEYKLLDKKCYGPWIDMFAYLIKVDLRESRPRPEIEHILYGLQSLAIRHQNNVDSHFTENVKTLVDFLIEQLKKKYGLPRLRPWAQEILIPEKGLSLQMKNYELFVEAVSYEPTIKAFLEELQQTSAITTVIDKLYSEKNTIDSAPGDSNVVPKIEQIVHSENSEIEGSWNPEVHSLIMEKFNLRIQANWRPVREQSLSRLRHSLSHVVALADSDTTDASSQTKTAVIMLSYHLALPSKWGKEPEIRTWARNYLKLIEDQEKTLSHIKKLIRAIRTELNIPSIPALH